MTLKSQDKCGQRRNLWILPLSPVFWLEMLLFQLLVQKSDFWIFQCIFFIFLAFFSAKVLSLQLDCRGNPHKTFFKEAFCLSLLVENLRNFLLEMRGQVKRFCAISVGCYFHICISRFSQDHQLKTWQFSPRLFFFKLKALRTARQVFYYEKNLFNCSCHCVVSNVLLFCLDLCRQHDTQHPRSES